MSNKINATAQKLVDHCRKGTETQGLDDYYASDAVSAEAMAMPGEASNEVQGVAAIKAKHEWWNSNFDVHETNVTGPYMHGGDRFSVIFEMDVTNKAENSRSQMTEVAIYHCNDEGKITREEFFYNPE